MASPLKHLLFVNLASVRIRDVYTYSHALLLQQLEGKCTLQGFVTGPSQPTFELSVPEFLHEFVALDGQHAFLRGPGWLFPIVLTSNSELGIQRIVLPEGSSIEYAMDLMEREVAAYWTDPSMPCVSYQDTAVVRRMLGVTARPIIENGA